MTRTDVMASSRSRTRAASPMRKGSPRISRWLSLLVAVLALALVAPAAAVAAEPTSKYNSTPTTPSTGTSPSKESSKPTPTPATSPSKESAPATTPAVPAKEAKASTLPFTGFDLRWSVAIGLMLMGAGLSIVAVQRRQRHR
jgi:cytoskeletal protein RodZ